MTRRAAGPPISPETVRRLRSALLRWYRLHRRDLPWRSARSPYAVWVSEIMLQQTQVETVLPYYRRFLERFPDVFALADATEDDVLSAWSGLGYYRRARSLHGAARIVVSDHGGRIPDDPARLRALPGVGRYTAGAIASIAYGREEPVLDGNVRRVISRLLADPAPREARLWEVARDLARGPRPGDLNEALMELGALVCAPRGPRCRSCPIRDDCAGHASGRPGAYPAARPRRPTERARVAVAVIRRRGGVLLERPDGGSPLRGTWDLPAVEIEADADAPPVLATRLLRRHRLEVRVDARIARASHGILHRRLGLEAHACVLLRGRPSASRDLRWVRPEDLVSVPVSAATKKLVGPTQ